MRKLSKGLLVARPRFQAFQLKRGFSTSYKSLINRVQSGSLISIVNKFAVLKENKDFSKRIVFSDLKFSLEISENQTLSDLASSHRKKSELDGILTMTFLDEDDIPIASNTKSTMLLRLPSFKISMDSDRLYHCYNLNYMGNRSLDVQIKRPHEKPGLDRLVIEEDLSYRDAFDLQHRQEPGLTFRDLLNEILYSKYHSINELESQAARTRENRLNRLLNFFFYMTFVQVLSLNLCTFVFFNWDIMEPITACLTFSNLICGYYFWVFTKCDYDPESILNYLRERTNVRRRVYRELIDERREIDELLNERI